MAGSSFEIGAPKARDLVPSQMNDAVKMHHVYDVSNRLITFYTTQINAANGEACLATKYTYDGTSNRVVGAREYLTTWNSAWDITVP